MFQTAIHISYIMWQWPLFLNLLRLLPIFSLWSGVKLIASQEKSQRPLPKFFPSWGASVESWCEMKTQGVTDICEFIWVSVMLLTAEFWQECCEISSQAWSPLGSRRKHSLRACLLFNPVPVDLHFTSALNTWPDRVLHCKLGGASLITAFPMVHAWDLSSVKAGNSSKPMARFHDLSLLTKDSKPAWKAQLPEGSWSNSWNKTNKNNYRVICEDVKTSTNTLTLTNPDMNLERVA